MKQLLITLLVLATPWEASAASGPMRQFTSREPVAIDPATAYVLFRTDPRAVQHSGLARWSFDFVFVAADALLPNATTTDRKTVNVFRPHVPKTYDTGPDAQFVLLSLPPGRYVLAGLTTKDAAPIMGTCLCMGTVEFEARPGVVTDLGYLLGEIDGLPPAAPEFPPTAYSWSTWNMFPPMMAAAVRPPSPAMPAPEPLKAATIVPADYRAFGKFPNFFGGAINRLAPLKGVLDYDADRVVDLKAR